MEYTALLETLPSVGAIILIVIKFLQHLKEQRETYMKSQSEERSAFITTVNNHLEHNVEELIKLREVNTDLQSTIKELCFFIKNLNNKNKK